MRSLNAAIASASPGVCCSPTTISGRLAAASSGGSAPERRGPRDLGPHGAAGSPAGGLARLQLSKVYGDRRQRLAQRKIHVHRARVTAGGLGDRAAPERPEVA